MKKWTLCPNVLEVHTDMVPIRGFAICRYNQKYNSMFNSSQNNSGYTYRYEIGKIDVPKEPDYRYHYYSIKDDNIYYERKIGALSLRFSYDSAKKTLKTTSQTH